MRDCGMCRMFETWFWIIWSESTTVCAAFYHCRFARPLPLSCDPLRFPPNPLTRSSQHAIASGDVAVAAGSEIQDSDSSSGEDDVSLVDSASRLAERLLLTLSKTIGAVVKLSVIFRNPVPLKRYQKAKTIDTYDWQRRDEEFLDYKFPRLELSLRPRLVQAILSRRQFLQYCKKHHSKLARGVDLDAEEELGSDEGVDKIADESDTTASRYAGTGDQGGKTQAPFREEDKQSVSTYLSDTDDGSRPVIPASPVEPGGDPFPCPYCYLYIEVVDEHDWR